MQYKVILGCLVGLAVATPLPPRETPVIGVVVPSDVPMIAPMYVAVDSMQRPAPVTKPLVSDTTVLNIAMPSVATPDSTYNSKTVKQDLISAITTTGSNTIGQELKPGSRYLQSGNVDTIPSTGSSPSAEMGEAVSRKKPGKKAAFVTREEQISD